MGNGGGTGEKTKATGREPPSSSSHASKSKRHRSTRGDAMADRFFPNDFPDFVAEAEAEAPGGGGDRPAGVRGLLSLPYASLSDRFLRAARRLKDKARRPATRSLSTVSCRAPATCSTDCSVPLLPPWLQVVEETWVKAGRQVTDYTLYTGALGTALLLFKSFRVTGDRGDLALAADIVRACDDASQGLPFLTFICGRAGVCALGAVIAKHCDDQLRLTQYLSSFDEITITEKVPNELLYGRAGYLWACLFLNKHLNEKTIPLEHINSVAKDIIMEGRKLSSKGNSPLMYEWHGKKYWGAAHGLAGIMHVLMHTELKLDEQDDVKNTLRYMIKNRFPSGNYPSSEGNESDRLVHWCHGAPGVALTMAKAYEVFHDDHFKQSAAEAAEVVWNRGLLKRVGICHGVSGNAYVFLSLYRLTGNVDYLYRAKAFACFLLEKADELIAEGAMHGGDRPFSLFEGKAGMGYLLLDMIDPSESRFPAYEL
ncbi:lanC-like protein GCL2 isoform X1 [Panicum hallii]|uniref:lanC-like protein GCL2 isoform X1 n=1 Tax=Panicum hallii TaxID=206008 RepID=UPI000DF4E304|nr:lanC-like protein GCL2 isoform X1 [Panicum hallii]